MIVIAFFVSVVSPLILSLATIGAQRADKLADWARQDQVAAKAAAAVAAVATASKETNAKLDVIHTLVNSNMTAAMQAEYDAVVVQAAMMREVIDLKRASGKPPTAAAADAVTAIDKRIAELRSRLEDRAKQSGSIEKTK